jgi:hypothetical protein
VDRGHDLMARGSAEHNAAGQQEHLAAAEEASKIHPNPNPTHPHPHHQRGEGIPAVYAPVRTVGADPNHRFWIDCADGPRDRMVAWGGGCPSVVKAPVDDKTGAPTR